MLLSFLFSLLLANQPFTHEYTARELISGNCYYINNKTILSYKKEGLGSYFFPKAALSINQKHADITHIIKASISKENTLMKTGLYFGSFNAFYLAMKTGKSPSILGFALMAASLEMFKTAWQIGIRKHPYEIYFLKNPINFPIEQNNIGKNPNQLIIDGNNEVVGILNPNTWSNLPLMTTEAREWINYHLEHSVKNDTSITSPIEYEITKPDQPNSISSNEEFAHEIFLNIIQG